MTRPAVPHSGWERALLVALLQNGDIEEVRLGEREWAQRGYRLSLIVPFSLLPVLEHLGAEEEDLEDSDHSGAGDEFGMDSDRELDLGATCDIDQEQAWRETRSFVADGEVDESRANDDAAGDARRRAVA